MIPIQELLSRIRWDKQFGQGDFEIGYHDRFHDKTIRVAFWELDFPSGDGGVFEVLDSDGTRRRIPFHRVREVLKDGEVIWERRGSAPSEQSP